MSTPKNNLADILRRAQDLNGCASWTPPVSHPSKQKVSRFKPPKAASPLKVVRQPHTGYLSFSTPGFHNSTDNVSVVTPVASTCSSGPSQFLLPSKRSSGDSSTSSTLSGAPIKRTKLKHPVEKENFSEEPLVILDAPGSFVSRAIVTPSPSPRPRTVNEGSGFVRPVLPPTSNLETDSSDGLRLRLLENIRLRDFLEEQLRNGCRDDVYMKQHLELCLDRICVLEKEQSVRRRRTPSQQVQPKRNLQKPVPSDMLPEGVPLKSNKPQIPEVSISDDEDSDPWCSFSDIPDLDFDLIHSTSGAEASSSKLAYSAHQPSSPYSVEALEVLNRVFSLKSFRHNQLEAITAAMDGKDVFVLMPTGGGKSICYQVPAICNSGEAKGVTIIISPLIALMTDQVESLKRKGVDAVRITSDMNQQTYFQIHDRLLGKGRKPAMVYIAPERLQSNDTFNGWLQTLYGGGQLTRFVIDEAHCVCTWGRDFRDAYKDLGRLRQNFPTVPIMALTATANQQVRDDVINQLGIQGCLLLQQSFNRPNLNYEVRPKSSKVVSDIAAWIRENHAGHTGVIYARTKMQCEKVAEELREHYKLNAEYYHADLDPTVKAQRLTDWLDGTIKIVVATIAFGMGVDKADVRFVIHHTLPKSFDSYYQETGRAGRDGLPADCILYFTHSDVVNISSLIEKDEVAPSERLRQLDALKEVERFCYNNTDCRRKQILHHFDQDFDPKGCRRLCDVCAKDELLVEEDVSQAALDILRLTRDLSSNGEHTLKSLIMAVYRGAQTKAVKNKGYDKHDLFGAGKGVLNDKVDRLFGHLLCEKGLAYQTIRKGGWSNSYLVLGPAANEFFNGRVLKMKFKVNVNSSLSCHAPIQKRSKRVKDLVPVNQSRDNAVISDDFEELYVGDNYFASEDIEMSQPPKPRLLSRKRSKFSSSVNEDDAIGQCLQELKEVRSNIAAIHEYSDPAELIGDDDLECLSLMHIEDMDQLKNVLADCNVDSKRIIKIFGKDLLTVCQKYHFRKLQVRERLHEQYDFSKSRW